MLLTDRVASAAGSKVMPGAIHTEVMRWTFDHTAHVSDDEVQDASVSIAAYAYSLTGPGREAIMIGEASLHIQQETMGQVFNQAARQSGKSLALQMQQNFGKSLVPPRGAMIKIGGA